MRKCPYIAHFGLKWKNKTTLFCQTFKVEEKKVVLFFNFELNQARYGHFLVFDIFALMSPFVKFEPPCGTPKSVPIWLKIFLVYILMYWNGINNLLSTFETLFEIWSTLVMDSQFIGSREPKIKGWTNMKSRRSLDGSKIASESAA